MLLARVFDAEDMGYWREAWSIYEEWRSGKLGFEEARKKLEQLLAEAKAAARA